MNGKTRIESLIKILCHDINNPLMNIKLRIKLLEKQDEFKHNKNIEHIKKSASDIESMISHIRTWQASESGKVSVNLKPLRFAKIIPDLISQFEQKLINKNIEIIFNDLSNSSLDVLADEKVLYGHVMSNLISNAIKFSPRDSKITISFKVVSNLAVVEVLDHGMGIPDALILKIFSSDEATNRHGTEGEEGTGFGLPIVKSFVEAMDGKIHIESKVKDDVEDESWTKFIIDLPLAG